jgi:hypothetical protein
VKVLLVGALFLALGIVAAVPRTQLDARPVVNTAEHITLAYQVQGTSLAHALRAATW